jgi:ABC-2 type transport system ATP-binding protein
MQIEHMIHVSDLVKKYGNTTAVDNLSFHARKGEIFGLLGPNGAGKTTTLKVLAGLLFPTSGIVEVDRLRIPDDIEKIKMMTGYVPDKPHLYEKLTGNETLEFVRQLYSEQNNEETIRYAQQLIEMFSLTSHMNDLVESYSHGMRQKLVLTSALMLSPALMVIDEPMVGLDARGMRQVKELLRNLADKGSTVLLSTHTMSVAQEVCDTIAIIDNGKLKATGTFADLQRMAGEGEQDLESVFLRITEEKE